MNYMLMCCFDENRWKELPEALRSQIMDQYKNVIQDLKKSGHYLIGAKLDESTSAISVQEKNGNPMITDGPFAETKEQLGGYHLVQCKDMDEAISIAKRIPTLASGGKVEVRQVLSQI